MANRAAFGDLLEPGMRKIFDDRLQAQPTQYEKVFNVLTSTKQDETDSSVSGFGQFTETSEDGTLTYEDPLQGYDVSYVHKSWKKGFKVTEEMYEDDQYNVMQKMPSKLAVSASRTVETQAAKTLINAFSGSYLGGDGKALCASDHPRSDGGTAQDNATVAVLAESALKELSLLMRGTLDDKGQLVLVSPNRLIVPPALEDTAKVLLQSTGRPYNATTIFTNDINPYKDKYELLVWDYLSAAAGGSDTAWYLQDTALHELNFFWRKRPVFEQDNSFTTDEALFKGKMRFSNGWSDWRGFGGSTGAGA